MHRRLTAELRPGQEGAQGIVAPRGPDRARFFAELGSVEAAIATVRVDDPAAFRTVFPMNEPHRRIFAVQAAVWRARGLRGVVVWPADRWGMLGPTQPPRGATWRSMSR